MSFEEKVAHWYEMGFWDKSRVAAMVRIGKITAEAYERITGDPYEGGE